MEFCDHFYVIVSSLSLRISHFANEDSFYWSLLYHFQRVASETTSKLLQLLGIHLNSGISLSNPVEIYNEPT